MSEELTERPVRPVRPSRLAMTAVPAPAPPVPAPYTAQVRAAVLSRLARPGIEGPLAELLPRYPERAGKGVRSTFLVGTCGALGGTEAAAIPFAVAVELLHNAFLVHDDISDGSRLRRGAATLPVEVGTGLALCAGNALAIEALTAARDAAHAARIDATPVLDEMEQTIRRTLEGQARELEWERSARLDVTVADYLEMVVQKSSFYSVVLPCRLGALVATRRLAPEAFVRSGALIGAVLQIADDLQSLLAPAAVTGKEFGDDISEGKRSLPVIHCLTSGSELNRRRLERLLDAARGERDPDVVAEVLELLHRTGGIDYARESAQALADAARRELDVDLEGSSSAAHAALLYGALDSFVARCG